MSAWDTVHGADIRMVVDIPVLQYKITKTQSKMRQIHFSSIWQ